MKELLIVFASVLVFLDCAAAQVKQDFILQGNPGKLSAVLHTPKYKKSYPLVIMHGFNTSKDMELLTDRSQQLNKRSMATLLFDFNGHGKKAGHIFLKLETLYGIDHNFTQDMPVVNKKIADYLAEQILNNN